MRIVYLAGLLIILNSGCSTPSRNAKTTTSGASSTDHNLAVPIQAENVGYKNLTFNDDFNSINTIDTAGSKKTGYNWYIDPAIWGDDNAIPSAYKVSNSVLTVTNSGHYTGNWTLSSFSSRGNVGHSFRYGYFEARIRFDPTLGKKGRGFPAWWSLSTYHSRVNNMDHWAELDFFEAYTGGLSEYEGAFVGTVHDWADSSKKHYQNSNNWQPLPKETDFTQWHTYGCLWEPGKITWYFDDKPLMTLTYSATALPNPIGNPPAPVGTYFILDRDPEGLLLILGSDTEWPLDVDWVRVWQENSTNPFKK
jgi:beta-glucanase (GH16 family)